jgi:hypothetical protein
MEDCNLSLDRTLGREGEGLDDIIVGAYSYDSGETDELAAFLCSR